MLAVKNERQMQRARDYQAVVELLDGLEREAIEVLAFATVVNAGLALNNAPLPAPETSLDAERLASVMTTAQKILRLERGESTANTLSASVDPAYVTTLRARLAELESRGATVDAPSLDGESASTPTVVRDDAPTEG